MNSPFDEERTAPRPPRRSGPRAAASSSAPRTVVPLAPATARGVLVAVEGDDLPSRPDMRLPAPAPPVAPSPLDYPSLLALTGMKAPSRARPGRRRSRRLAAVVRVLLVAAVLAGLVFGGIEVKHRVLDLRWDDSVADEAAAVARQRGLDWTRALPVDVVDTETYAVALADAGLVGAGAHRDPGGSFTEAAAEWRALGLLEGSLDVAALGGWASTVMPAFYDPVGGRIVLAAGVDDEARAAALHRALTLALLDQRFDWSQQMSTAGPAIRAGIRARSDGDALDVAAVLVGRSLDELRAQVEVVGSRVPVGQQYPFEVVTNRIAFTVADGFATVRSLDERDARHTGRVPGEEPILDGSLVGTVSSADLTVAAGHSLGRLAWWYALAGRVPADDAESAALRITGDVVEHVDSGCVRATVWAGTPESADRLESVFRAWATAAPDASSTSVRRLTTGSGVEIRSCDPGPSADTVTVGGLAPPT